ncbi:Protein translocation protein SEC63 [Spathaspora sp. JA1]|nr:Protein translocation protein SEC63 [Spathaspora sp. JA1]
MASSEYNYDESGETWPFFVLAILSVILIPLTIRYVLRIRSNSDPIIENQKIKGSIKEDGESIGVDNVDSINQFKRKQKSDRIFNKTLILLVLGWAMVVYVGKYVTKESTNSSLFDPYAILDVSFSSTEQEIKSHYRKLSLKYHPDKLPRDLTQEVKDQMEQEYIKLTSAYKALTDQTMRENYIRYGHPDGEQPTTHGIALPQFLVEGKYSSIVVVGYFVLIGVLLPYIVGKWWNNVKSHTRKGLHVETAAGYTRKLTDRDPGTVITPHVILDWVLESEEVQNKFKHLTNEQIKSLVNSHLNREFSTDKSIEYDKIELVAKLPYLIQGLIDIAVVFRVQDVILPAEDLKKSIVQAVPINGRYHELLQLPFVDRETVVNQPIKKLGKLFTLSQEEAKKTLGITDDSKLKRALDVASHIPTLRILEAGFKLPGEEDVHPHSNAHLSIKFLVKSPRLKSCPEISEEKLKDEETLEYLKNPFIVNEQQPELPFAYAPYFPQGFRTSWDVILINQKDNKLVEESVISNLENIDVSNLDLSQEVWKNGEQVIIGTFKIPMTQPTGDVGKYAYRLLMKNNSYFGADVDVPVYLEVKPIQMKADISKLKKKLGEEEEDEEESDSDSDISDPEEDSLAGALAALSGGSAKKSSKIVELDDDDSDNESVFTDINTDTEDEAD